MGNRLPKFLKYAISLVLIGLLVYVVTTYIRQEVVISQQEDQIAQMQKENKDMETEYQEMVDSVSQQGTEEYIESYMRSRFGMVKQNEVIIDVEGATE